MKYWNHFTSPVERSGFEQVTDGFKKDFPAIDLKVEAIQNQDWMTKYITAVQAKSGPDAIMVTASRIADMVRIGGLASLQVRSDAWPTLKSNNAEGAVKGMQYLGQQYALPCFIFIDWMYSRKDFFAAKGLKEAQLRQAGFIVVGHRAMLADQLCVLRRVDVNEDLVLSEASRLDLTGGCAQRATVSHG